MEGNKTVDGYRGSTEYEKEVIEEYKQLVDEEIAKYEAALKEAESQYKQLKNKSLPAVTLSESQQRFLDERPNYVEYLTTNKQFRDLYAIRQLKEYHEMKAKVLQNEKKVKNAIKKNFNL